MSDLEDLEAYVFEPTEISTRKQAAARRNLAKAAKTASARVTVAARKRAWLCESKRNVPSLPKFSFSDP
jgi:hypothetical protein